MHIAPLSRTPTMLCPTREQNLAVYVCFYGVLLHSGIGTILKTYNSYQEIPFTQETADEDQRTHHS